MGRINFTVQSEGQLDTKKAYGVFLASENLDSNGY